jgi:hypothetical protein
VTTAEAPVRHVWQPNARQRDVLQVIANTPVGEYCLIGYGGAAGGAKTNLLANYAIDIAIGCPGSRTLIGRNEMVHLKTTTLEEFDKALPPGIEIKTNDSSPIRRRLRLPSWPAGVYSDVLFMGVKDARNSIGSEAFGWVLLDEAHDIAETDIRYLFSRLRHSPERKRGMIICFNPFPSVAVRWFMKGEDPGIDTAETPVTLAYVPARIADNPHLPANYEAMMFAGLDPYLRAVLLDGRAEAVPNAIYGSLNDPEVAQVLQSRELPEPSQWRKGVTGWDWGTSKSHKAAGVLLQEDNHGLVWVLDAWESERGSSDELKSQAQTWRNLHARATVARYDASQGSLRDDLSLYYPDTDKGIRDVEGRIRLGRGFVDSQRLRFNWRSDGARQLWEYLMLYHRDDDDKIVEEQDDMVDAFHYALWEFREQSQVYVEQGVGHVLSWHKAGRPMTALKAGRA